MMLAFASRHLIWTLGRKVSLECRGRAVKRLFDELERGGFDRFDDIPGRDHIIGLLRSSGDLPDGVKPRQPSLSAPRLWPCRSPALSAST